MVINPISLQPLQAPWEEPRRHRVRGKTLDSPAEVVAGRRPSPLPLVQALRDDVDEWRSNDYAGASATSRELLHYWFETDHLTMTAEGEQPFSYYFCQREAIETLIYLMEVRSITTLSGLRAEFGGPNGERAAIGTNPDDDRWAKYAFKLATGAGKTKVMSLAIAWSYFHAMRETGSPMTTNFLVIAPGITVFERLRADFRPETGGPPIFTADPIIPPAWRPDWHLTVVLQDEPTPRVAGGIMYLTNVHRLYEKRTTSTANDETYSFVGPKVSKQQAYSPTDELRERVAAHNRILVLNDEAHHVWDPDSAWTETLEFLYKTATQQRGALVAQLDFSATPKDSKGQPFPHIVCDTPLGEAVDAGIVKTPIIGHGEALVERAHSDAAYRFENHLTLGYKRWQQSKQEWEKSGKKALLFVMTENTTAANEIAARLNADPLFKDLNGKTINLHTNLKGRLRKVGTGLSASYEFIENETAISDEDLQAIRRLARELDDNSSPYRCIVSVLMLREGWDVRNVTTILPLRPLTAKSRILPEQTLGRGLRRMTPPGVDQPAEIVTVVEHRAFASLYRDELAQEGLPLEIVDIEKVPRVSITIFPDCARKDCDRLEISIPRVSHGYRSETDLSSLEFSDIAKGFSRYEPLKLGQPQERVINYEGRHLITNEVVEQMRLKLPLLRDPIGAISFYREEIERAVKTPGLHGTLAPLLERFLGEVLFGAEVSLYDPRLVARLGDVDVREHVRAVFVPAVLARLIVKQKRTRDDVFIPLSSWKPFQANHSETHPAFAADKTLFNLVPCNRQLEAAMVQYLDRCRDVAAFAKNAGPQCLRIDSVGADGQRSLYSPDFLVRLNDGRNLVVETKGRVDPGVSAKASAAVEWCKAASAGGADWQYVYVPQGLFERLSGDTAEALLSAARPSLVELLDASKTPQLSLNLDSTVSTIETREAWIPNDVWVALPSRYQQAIEHALALYTFHRDKGNAPFGAVFQPLLGPMDHAAETLLISRLAAYLPSTSDELHEFFRVDPTQERHANATFLADKATLLRKLLVFRSPVMPIGLLAFCLNYAKSGVANDETVLGCVSHEFRDLAQSDLRKKLEDSYNFRNQYVAHEKKELRDSVAARDGLRAWIDTLIRITLATNGDRTA